MQNLGDSQTQKFSRRDYNKRYYEQNKSKILLKRKGQIECDLPPTFAGATETKGSSRTLRKILTATIRTLELTALACLTAVMTYFLIKESAGFYLDSNESPASAYIKASMIELTAILFSFSRSKNQLLRWGQRTVVVMLCGLSLWTMSGKVVKNAAQDSAKVQASIQVIRELEAERNQKEALREQFLSRGWLHRTRNYERGLDQIREKLIAARQTMSSMDAPHVIANSLGVLIAFRLILLISNLICVHQIVEFFTREAAHQR